MNLPQTSAINDRRKDEAKAKRLRLLSLVPTEFTASQLSHVACISNTAAAAQIQMMQKWREIEPTSEYQKPRTYRKVNP